MTLLTLVDEAEGADWADGADRADGTDETDVAEMVLRMNALFYSMTHKELKNMAYNGLWESYAVTSGWMDGTGGTDHSPRTFKCYVAFESPYGYCGANKTTNWQTNNGA